MYYTYIPSHPIRTAQYIHPYIHTYLHTYIPLRYIHTYIHTCMHTYSMSCTYIQRQPN
ncbi:hypothetical protein F5B20DRAFT_553853 [Whalleya microplaca]|nr:hypothetical protein F5B20DRAFT_553853 [Whalleya microplaca]